MFSVSIENSILWYLSRYQRLFLWLCLSVTAVSNACYVNYASAEIKHETKKSASFIILLRGNEALSEAKLRHEAATELENFDGLGQRASDIDDAAYQMLLAYRNAGFAFAKVDYQIEKNDITKVTFTISEGPRVIMQTITFSGNLAFNDDALQDFFEESRSGLFGMGELLFIRSKFNAAIDEIRQSYIAQGYLDVVVETPKLEFSKDRSLVDCHIAIQEGVQHTVSHIEFHGDIIADAENNFDQIRQDLIGQPYFNRKKLLLQTKVLEAYGNHGFPNAAVDVKQRTTKKPAEVVLDVSIKSGPLINISAIEIRGNQRTRSSFIQDRIQLAPGDRYDLFLERESFRNLYKTGIFSKVDFELKKTDTLENRVLVVKVEETRSKELFFEPGWGSYEKLRLRVGFREKNLFGTARIFGTQVTGSLKAQSLVGNLTDPFFLNTDIRAGLNAFYNRREEPSFTRRDVGMSFVMSQHLTKNLSSTGTYMIRNTAISDTDEKEKTSSENYGFASLKLQATYDTRNDIFFPTSGQRIFASVEQADDILGSRINLSRLTGGARFFHQITGSTVIGARYTAGLLLPGRDEITLPLAERFFNGGENTVRSFKESEIGPQNLKRDPAGGYGFNTINIELRQRLIGNLIGSVFVDYGNISPNRSREEQGNSPYDSRSDVISDTYNDFFKGFRSGVGFGLQYLLPVGPARIDFAFNPDRDSERNEDFFVFHFSVGTAF
ncbi:MAG: outer membrane protein assembly factor BamA [Desulfobacterales bacterium]